MLKFTEEHEWLKVEGDVATVGITQHAAEQLGDLVYVELPAVGSSFDKNANAATVESVKAASDVYAPLSGEVVEANTALGDAPETVNEAAESDGWFAKLKVANPADYEGLMDRAAYDEFLKTL